MAQLVAIRDEADREAAQALRTAVFVAEQGVPPELEIDAYDAPGAPGVYQVLARDAAGQPVATGRFVETPAGAKVGRVAVRREARGQGWGRRVMDALEAEARARGLEAVVLNAQEDAIPFYDRLGYVPEGEPFEEAGIPHRRMRKSLRA